MYNCKLIHIFVLVLSIGLLSCGTKGNTDNTKSTDNAVENIDLIPMFGSTPEYGSIQKTPEQQQAISDFLISSDEVEPDRKAAANMYWEIAMNYIDNEKYDDAMKRVNQSWLLDPTNPDIYVAFAQILSLQEKHFEAIDMLDRASNLTDNKVIVLQFYLDEAFLYYKEKKDNSYLKKVLEIANKLPTPEEQVDVDLLNKIKEDANLYLNS